MSEHGGVLGSWDGHDHDPGGRLYAILRLLPGAIDAASLDEESFSTGLLEYPQYTRPPEFRGATVPEVLTSGNHAAVAAWRTRAAERRTAANRPDLIQGTSRPGTPRPDPATPPTE